MIDILMKVISFLLGVLVAYGFYKICNERKTIIMSNNLKKIGDIMEVDNRCYKLNIEEKNC